MFKLWGLLFQLYDIMRVTMGGGKGGLEEDDDDKCLFSFFFFRYDGPPLTRSSMKNDGAVRYLSSKIVKIPSKD